MLERLSRWLFWPALLCAFVMAILPHPPQLPGEPTDKVQHIAAFATLTLLAGLGYPRLRPLVLLASLVAFGALIEFVQAIPALHRSSDVMDWLADVAAVLVMLAAVIGLRRRRRTSN
jgi:VanZ family protein